MKTLSFVGFGAWGGALSIHLARHGASPIHAWEHLESIRRTAREQKMHPHLGEVGRIPDGIRILDQMEGLPWKNAAVFLGVGSDYLTQTLKALKQAKRKEGRPFACILLTKGLEPKTLEFFHRITARELSLPASDIFVLTGPTIAKELLAGAPTRAVLAGSAGAKQKQLVEILNRANFHVSAIPDAPGAQIGGSMKNIYAIGYGVLEAAGAPANAKAFYFLKALEEMAAMTRKLGGKEETAYGPAGLGDLLTTSLSPNSRNSRLGRLLAQGKGLEEIQKEIGMVTEGVSACEAYLTLARKRRMQLSLAEAVHRLIKGTTQTKEFLLGLGEA